MQQKKTLYKAYLDKKKEEYNREKVLKKYDISGDNHTIIINKNMTKLPLLILEIISKIIKFALYVTILILITIGATVLLNEELRNYICTFCNIL